MNKLLKIVGLFVLLTSITFCQGPIGPQGPQGSSGQDGANGTDGLPQPPLFEFITVDAARTYSPSTWDDREFELEQGVYALPRSLSVKSGNAGTGWASILLNGVRYCYQGAAGNNNISSDVFNYKGMTAATNQCFSASLLNIEPTFAVAEAATLEVEVNGGGCGSICANTEVEGSVLGFKEVSGD